MTRKLLIRFSTISTLSLATLLNLMAAPFTHAFSLSISDGANSARGTDQVVTLFGSTGIFTTLSNVMLFVVGAISVVMVIIGGLRYVISGGNNTNVTAAKNTILYAVVGLVISIMAYAIVNFIIGSFSPDGTGAGTNV
jgi:hypothetical protein